MHKLDTPVLERDIAVLKLSSGILLNEDEVGLDHQAVEDVADQVEVVQEDFHPLIVLGSAVGAGRAYLRDMGEDHTGVDAQVLASYGTPDVSVAVRDALRARGVKSGQVLANHNQMHAGSVLMRAILFGIRNEENAYHINENDQENVYELGLLRQEEASAPTVRKKAVGIDNDPLAAQLTIALIEELKLQGLSEELGVHLAIFTKVGGFVVDETVQPKISAGDREAVYAQCNGVRQGGSGGMRVKVEACFDAYDAGARSVHIAAPDQDWASVIKDAGEAGKVTKVVQ